MKHLFKEWSRVKIELENRFLAIFLDYDGTLTPIVETPDQAILSKDTKVLLRELVKIPDCKLAIISGRSLADIERLVGIKEIEYVGNHGLEMGGSAINFESLLTPQFKKIMEQIKCDLSAQLAVVKGALVEDKGLTLSIHYRLVSEKDISKFKNIFNQVTQPFVSKKEIWIELGKKVFEIRPPVEWGKGKAILWLLKKEQYVSNKFKVFSIYLGDDLTDENAFAAIKNSGLAILIGSAKSSHAKYYLKDTQEVAQFLKEILELKKGISTCQS